MRGDCAAWPTDLRAAPVSGVASVHVSEPRSQEPDCQALARAHPAPASVSGRKTHKEKTKRGRARSVRIMAASFTGCGMFGLLREVSVAESLSFAAHTVLDLLRVNRRLQSLGYDDGCRLAQALSRHPDLRVRQLDVWIDLFHLFGHVRAKCFLERNPLTRLATADQLTVRVTCERRRQRQTSHVDGHCGCTLRETLHAPVHLMFWPRSQQLLCPSLWK